MCSRCGCDTEKLRRILRWVLHWSKPVSGDGSYTYAGFSALLASLGFDAARGYRSLWDAHHIMPVEEGGGGCGLNGYATVCCPCHKEINAEQRDRRHDRRKRGKRVGRGTPFMNRFFKSVRDSKGRYAGRRRSRR